MTDTTSLSPPTRTSRPRAAWPGIVARRLPHRRTWLKWMHWTMGPLTVWFLLVQPKDVTPFGRTAFLFHSVLGLIFVTLALVWTADHIRRGLAGRPGPKLRGWTRRFHPALHKTLIWGLFGVALTGFLLGLTSSTLLKAGGFLPVAPPLDMPQANNWAGLIHIVEFYALSGVVAVHVAFHLWRHYSLRDNCLRIMAPKILHRFL